MTRTEFFTLFRGVAAPDHRGAPYPDFAPDQINESMFADELRCKSFQFDFRQGRKGDGDELIVHWTSQGWDETDTFVREVRRCLMHIGFVGRVKILMNQRSYGVYTERGARRRFVLRKEGAKVMKKDRKDTMQGRTLKPAIGMRFVVKWHYPGQKPCEGLRYHTDDIDEAVEVFRSYTKCGFLTTLVNRIAKDEVNVED